MLFKATHVTDYCYSRPVFLEPHVIRLRPRSDGVQQLRSFHLRIDPPPAGMTECLDIEGNATVQVWFSDNTERLCIATEFLLETFRINPFDFIISEVFAQSLPATYSPQDAGLLSSHRDALAADNTLMGFVEGIARECGGKILPFLDSLNRRIYQEFECIIRETGDPAPPQVTLGSKRGSCRDFAVLFIAACRCQGIAARFVSGYQEGDPDQRMRYLHAWAEVYLPGAGWRGYDPTHGLMVGAGHIALAASYLPDRATPVSGTFRGSGAFSTMAARIEIQKLKSAMA
ncbi:MAG: transglutaminase family protein [Deltaproteobacteria bacterium]|nr:transglutaminase family protein [Deltaproteobacteria bacterium]